MKVEFDNALNEAGWEMIHRLRECGDVGSHIFNNIKPCLKSAIEVYLENIKTETPEEKEAFDSMANGSEWDGKGLPPVGVECEAVFIEHEHKGYGEFLVLGYHKNYVWLEYAGKLGNKSKHYTAKIDLVKFRKPETPQQREERERLEAIHEMVDDFNDTETDCSLGGRVAKVCAALYDSGYRKGAK